MKKEKKNEHEAMNILLEQMDNLKHEFAAKRNIEKAAEIQKSIEELREKIELNTNL